MVRSSKTLNFKGKCPHVCLFFFLSPNTDSSSSTIMGLMSGSNGNNNCGCQDWHGCIMKVHTQLIFKPKETI